MRHTGSLIAVVAALAVTGCSSAIDTAKEEMTASCLSSANGRLTRDECECMTDESFASLSSDQRALLGAVSSQEQGIDDATLAERLGMEPGEMRREMSAIQRQISSAMMSSALTCAG